MSKNLVIVESPAKARTVGKFLGKDFTVRASIGHIRDLPEKRFGVDIENGFEPHYVIPPKKEKVVRELRGEVKEASAIYLATDPDREGEAISWHLIAALKPKKKPVHRVVFHEITREAINEAFSHPRDIDMQLVNAQQARRILDRLVGYSISPLLRRKIARRGLSAGRVQSVAVRLVVERERAIQSFVPEEYWTIEADLAKLPEGKRKARKQFHATLHQVRGEKPQIASEEAAKKMVADLEGAGYWVAEVRRKDVQRHPAPPFTTSTLQQEASRRFGFTAKRTMVVAQQLYEGVEMGAEGSVGLITYMRTDSTTIAETAQAQIRDFVREHYGDQYLPAKPPVYKTKTKGAQEAHEAIRPTSVLRQPETVTPYLTPDQEKLYRLIWQRTVASQMASAIFDSTSVDIGAGESPDHCLYLFQATASVVKFPGFMLVYTEKKEEEAEEEGKKALPPLAVGERLELVALLPEQHFTQPPPRYSEATLVKALEEYGIGRPSTYAPTMSTIQARGYVERVGKQLHPTEMGFIVNDLLVQHFPDIVDIGFTAQMEEELDEIARGEEEWVPVLRDFYGPFEATLRRADQAIEPIEFQPEPTGETCEQCGKPMVIKNGRFGKFIACSGFPQCRNAKSFAARIGLQCPECGGDLVEKRTRRRRTFYGCNNYPSCTFASWNKPIPMPCPQCGGLLALDGKKGAQCTKCQHLVPLTQDMAEVGA